MTFLALLGRVFLVFVSATGRIFLFSFNGLSHCVRQLGATTLSITHDMVSAKKIADRIALIHRGKIIWNGATDAIEDSGSDYVDQSIHGKGEGPIKMKVTAQ